MPSYRIGRKKTTGIHLLRAICISRDLNYIDENRYNIQSGYRNALHERINSRMNDKQTGIFRWILLALTLATLLSAMLQIVTVTAFNHTLRTTVGPDNSEEAYAEVHARGNETSSWIKRETHLEGMIYDADIFNNSDMQISSWTLRIDILGECFLNQFWNGETEIHQNTEYGEKIQRLNLASFKEDEIILDHRMDDSDLLIPLSPGDYVIYYPARAVGEEPVASKEKSVIGLIVYTNEGTLPDLTDYTLEYHFRQTVNQGVLFIVFCVLAGFLLLVGAFYFSAQITYRRAQKEIDQRVESISCMTELYSLIYIIDLAAEKIYPVGISEKDDSRRPKDKTASEQMKNLFITDAEPEYLDLMLVFSNLKTLPRRLSERKHISQEYMSRYYGWCRVNFIPMDRKSGKPLTRILFTVQQINDERREMEAVLQQIEDVRSQSVEREEFMESISAEVQTPLRSILARSRAILKNTGETESRECAEDISQTGEMLLSMVNSTLDYVRMNAGIMKLSEGTYPFRKMISRVEDSFRISAQEKSMEFRVEISPAIPDRLIGDGAKMRQLLINVLGRALGEMESGSIMLRIYGRRLNENRIHLLFSVWEIGQRTGLEETELNRGLINGLLGLMGSRLHSAEIDGGQDIYFEVEQEIPEEERNPEGEAGREGREGEVKQ